jgi:hypothetical protein
MTKRKAFAGSLIIRPDRAQMYREVRGKIVDQVEHEFEEGILFLHVRFTDNTELCWRITTGVTIEKADLADWKTGNLKRLKIFVHHEKDECS